MKKILIVTGSLGLGGLEKVVAKIANFYVEKNFKVIICCLFGSSKKVFVELDKSINIYFLNVINKGKFKKMFKIFYWIKCLKKICNVEKPDYILAMTLKIGALCTLARTKDVERLTFREITDPKSKNKNWFIDRMLFFICRKIDGIIFQTEWEKKCYPKFLQKKGDVIPNPIFVNAIPLKTNREEVIVTTGRLFNFSKRHDILIKAFSVFLKNNPTYKLKIYGDGPDEIKDRNLIKELNLDDKVIIEHAKRDIYSCIYNAKMFVLTSEWEGLSNSLVEAMLLGLPCISSNWNGCNEIIENGVNGYIYKKQNINELASLMNLLANDENKCMLLSKNARLLADRFDPAKVLVRYAKVIEGE